MVTANLSPATLAAASPAGLALYDSQGWWQYAHHLQVLNDYLLRLTRREFRKLMVFMPPRHGKSEMISHYFLAWYLSVFPDHRIILTSYADSLARQFGMAVRDLFLEHGPELWGLEVNQSSAAKDDWNLDGYQGGMRTAGVGGAITGRGADVFVMDDPVKNLEEAFSAVIQERNIGWYRSTARTRLHPDAIQILVMTRWHEADLAGMLLAEQDDWVVLRLTARAEDEDPLGRSINAPLWPERYGETELNQIEREVGPYVWQAEYQQQPELPASLMFFHRSAIDAGRARCREPLEVRPYKSMSGDETGYITIYERPLASALYYGGADTAQGKQSGEVRIENTEDGGPDYHHAFIFKYPEHTEVAHIHGRMEEHEFAALVHNWFRAYNWALVAPERNRRAVLVVLRQLGYPNIFRTEAKTDMHVLPRARPARQYEYGWATTAQSRPLMLADLQAAMSTGAIVINDKSFWEEARYFIRSDPPKALPGKHDDRIMAAAISWQIRTHVRRPGGFAQRLQGVIRL